MVAFETVDKRDRPIAAVADLAESLYPLLPFSKLSARRLSALTTEAARLRGREDVLARRRPGGSLIAISLSLAVDTRECARYAINEVEEISSDTRMDSGSGVMRR